MLISTKGRYALQVMCDLLAHDSGDYVPLKEIAARQSISQKYLLRCTEGSLAPVACVEDNACARQGPCMACSLWEGLQNAIDGYLDGITLTELLKNTNAHRKESVQHG